MASTDEKNPYELLGVTLESTEGEIKTAYRKLSLKVHPDRVRQFKLRAVGAMAHADCPIESKQSRCWCVIQ